MTTSRPRRRPPLFSALVLAPALSFLIGGATALQAQEVELRWKLQPGDEHLYRQVTSTRMLLPMGEMTQEQSFEMRFVVVDRDDAGVARVRIIYDAVREVHDGPMGRLEYDSSTDEPPTDPGLAATATLVGQGLEMTMMPDGSVTSISGMDALMDRMMEVMAADDPEAAAAVREVVDNMFSEEVMQQGFQALPVGPVSVGTSWENGLDVQLPFGTMRTEHRFTVSELTQDDGRLIVRTDISGSTGAFRPDPDNAMARMISISGGDISGEMSFDVGRGLLVRSSVTSSILVTAMGESVRTRSTQTTELVDRQP